MIWSRELKLTNKQKYRKRKDPEQRATAVDKLPGSQTTAASPISQIFSTCQCHIFFNVVFFAKIFPVFGFMYLYLYLYLYWRYLVFGKALL